MWSYELVSLLEYSHDQAAMKDCVVSRAPVNSAIGWEPTGLMKCWHCIACNLQRS